MRLKSIQKFWFRMVTLVITVVFFVQSAGVYALAPKHKVLDAECVQKCWEAWLMKHSPMMGEPKSPDGERTYLGDVKWIGEIVIKQDILRAVETRTLNYLILSGIEYESQFLISTLEKCFYEIGIDMEEWTINIVITNLDDHDLEQAKEAVVQFIGKRCFKFAFIKLDNTSREQTDTFCDTYKNILGECDGIISVLIAAHLTLEEHFASRLRQLLGNDGWIMTDAPAIEKAMALRGQYCMPFGYFDFLFFKNSRAYDCFGFSFELSEKRDSGGYRDLRILLEGHMVGSVKIKFNHRKVIIGESVLADELKTDYVFALILREAMSIYHREKIVRKDILEVDSVIGMEEGTDIYEWIQSIILKKQKIAFYKRVKGKVSTFYIILSELDKIISVGKRLGVSRLSFVRGPHRQAV